MKSYTHFTLEERECLAQSLIEGKSLRQIAKELKRSPSSVSREVKRNFSKKKKRYNPWRAQNLYIIRRKRCRQKYKITKNIKMYNYIIARLNKYWSPEVIAHKCKEKSLNYLSPIEFINKKCCT